MKELTLSARIQNALNRENIPIDPKTLSRLEYFEIRRIRELGKKSQKELRRWLQLQGYDFKNAPADKVIPLPLPDELDAINFLKSRGYSVQRIPHRTIHPSN